MENTNTFDNLSAEEIAAIKRFEAEMRELRVKREENTLAKEKEATRAAKAEADKKEAEARDAHINTVKEIAIAAPIIMDSIEKVRKAKEAEAILSSVVDGIASASSTGSVISTASSATSSIATATAIGGSVTAVSSLATASGVGAGIVGGAALGAAATAAAPIVVTGAVLVGIASLFDW